MLIKVWAHKLQSVFEEYAKAIIMHVLTFTAVTASETQFDMKCCQMDGQTNKLVDGWKLEPL